ncbi:MAG: ABC-type bacteriocin/lantibiotic exporter with double-glycine peptidase domain [Cyclobacteriaceae bacterium]|jgi:ABC-type bacteriocin/lantibiotic exporter with double-glycine peptidase domain
MNNQQIIRTLQESANFIDINLASETFAELDRFNREYPNDELIEFIRDLVETGNDAKLILLEKNLDREDFYTFADTFQSTPIIVFAKGEELEPIVIRKKGKKTSILKIGAEETTDISNINIKDLNLAFNERLEVIFISVFDYKSLVSDQEDTDGKKVKLSPVVRLFRLLAAEKQDIFYVYIYAGLTGLLGLSLPLGIQAAIELISGGVVFSSIYVLIGLVILGVLGSGILQVLQITIVEYLQRRVFTKAAFEFAFRVPRIKMEAVLNLHMPELMNRFFDVLTLQKGLPKLLIDLSTAVIQILFGLLLLSFYHPFFVFFGLMLISSLAAIFLITGPKGLKSSIIESKYKYKVVYWLEELARALYSFKLSGNTALPLRKTEYNVNNYLKNRSTHFKVLISQYAYMLAFKAIVTGGLLIIGMILVVEREITLGQFVASEIIIILILASVEKIIMYMDVVYDMLTAVDKIAHVTDLPLESTGGIDIPKEQIMKIGISVNLKNVSYDYGGGNKVKIKNINMKIAQGEHICISGPGASGKRTLTSLIAGIHTDYEGIITYNNYSLRDLDRTYLRDKIGKNVSQEDIFEGTILDNILLGKPFGKMENAVRAIEKVGISDLINQLPDGLNTEILSGGKGFPSTFVKKLILARCLAKEPKILILNDFFDQSQKHEKIKLIELLIDPANDWTLILISNDPMIMASCDRVIYMESGEVLHDTSFEKLVQIESIAKNIY